MKSSSRILWFFRRCVRILGIAGLAFCLVLFGCQSRMIYFPRPYDKEMEAAITGDGGKSIEYETSAGKQRAWYLPSTGSQESPPEWVWLVFGGNGALSLDYLPNLYRPQRSEGFYFIDYPSYGANEGKPSPATIRESIKAAVAALRLEQGWPNDSKKPGIAIFGHSLGAAAGLLAAEDFGSDRVILLAPFTSMTEMAKRVVGWPLCYINRHRFDNVTQLKLLTANPEVRVVMFHGNSDDIIPARMSRELVAISPNQIRLQEVGMAGHNDILDVAGKQIRDAMDEILREPTEEKLPQESP